MLAILLLCLMLISQAQGQNCTVDSSFNPFGDLEFQVVTMTCNDAGDTCSACFPVIATEGATPVLHILEYVTNPYKLLFMSDDIDVVAARKISFYSDEGAQPFQVCTDISESAGQWIWLSCLANDIPDEISIPADCQPIAIAKVYSTLTDQQVGQQMLICLP